jgi:RimJ/RimL family protein N-acetyltransferase
MSECHVTVERERVVTPSVILRPWSADDAAEATAIYGDQATADAIGRRPVADESEMRTVLARWAERSTEAPVPQGLWAVEAVDDGRLVGGASLLPFSLTEPDLVMGWHLHPGSRGSGIAGVIGHALAHQAFFSSDVDDVFVVAGTDNAASIAVARRLGMSDVKSTNWSHHGIRLHVLRMTRDDLHRIRPGVSLDNAYNPEGLDDW